MSEQRVDFSKRCSNGPSKIEHHFRKQSSSKIEVFKKMTITNNAVETADAAEAVDTSMSSIVS